MRIEIRYWLCVSLCVFTAMPLFGQQPRQRAAIPPNHVYHHLFRYIVHLESLRGQGADNTLIAVLSKKTLETSDSETLQLRREARLYETEIEIVDREAQAITRATRNRYPQGRLSPGEAAPAVPPILLALQQRKESILAHHIDNLKASLGNSRFANLDQNLANRFLPKIHLQQLPLPTRPSGPTIRNSDPMAH